MYTKRTRDRVYQGDVLKDFVYSYPFLDEHALSLTKITEPYVVVLSQDCDLKWDAHARSSESGTHDKYVANIIIAPAYIATLLKEGNHLAGLDYKMNVWGTKHWEIICASKNERFHFLREDPDSNLPSLVIDFRRFYAIPRDMIYLVKDEQYVTSLDALYREDVSRRFSNFASRIGLPEELD